MKQVGVTSDKDSRRLEWLQRLGAEGLDPRSVEQALTHRSFVYEKGLSAVRSDNERLEFLGDAVIGLIVAEHLYRVHPTRPEGELTRLKSRLVSRSTMGRIAHELGFGDQVVLGRGEVKGGGRERLSILGNALEALTGCVYLSRGLEATRAFVERIWHEEFRSVDSSTAIDPKSELQEMIQASQQDRPTYQIVHEEGPDHDKKFVSRVSSGGIVLGQGSGRSKREAEQAAAAKALAVLKDRGGPSSPTDL